LRSLFDHFVESSVTKMRKPEPDFYAHALRVVGCEAPEAVFLDDIGKNLKPARDMGIFTIHVQNETPLQYLEALQKLQ
ncbi:EPHX2, partial [Symbiodinium sp. KB8]